jgi:integrase
MARPPLPLGTAGKIRYVRSGKSWIARCGFRDMDGVTRPVERSGVTKAAAERTLKEAIRDRTSHARDSELGSNSKVSVAAEAWWKAFAAREGSLNTKRLYRGHMENHVIPRVGEIRCREFSTALAERAIRQVEVEHGRHVASAVRKVLSNICGFAARMGAMERNYVRDTSPVNTKPKSDPKALETAELRQLRAYVTYHPASVRRDVPAVIDFMASTGERVGEALAVTTDSVNVQRRTVEIRGTVIRYAGVGLAIQRRPKSDAGFRTLTLPDWAMASVEAHIGAAVEVPAKVVKINDHVELVIPPTVASSGRKRGSPPAWLQELLDSGRYREERIAIVFPTTKGTLRDPSNTSRDIGAAFAFAGLDGDTSHIIRKTVATQMDDAGVPLREIADQLGHARVSMTADVYLGRNRVATRGADALAALSF